MIYYFNIVIIKKEDFGSGIMKKNIIIIISTIIVFLVMGLFLLLMKTEETGTKYTADEIKFKDEYETLNGTDYKDSILKTITIENDNNIKYLTDNEIIDALTNGNKIIYLGWPECNWCRTMLPTLINTIKKNDIDTLYYLNFKELRNAYENSSDINKVKIYEKLLEIVGDDITNVFSEDSSRSGEKKIIAPTVIFIKDGKYIGLHEKTVDSQLKSSDELSKDEIKELENSYQNYIDKMNINVCVEEGC